MDFHAEVEKHKDGHFAKIGLLSYERYQLCKQVESCQKRIAEIDVLIAEQEAMVSEDEQAQRDFNTYLAVKENALTLEDIKKGVEEAKE